MVGASITAGQIKRPTVIYYGPRDLQREVLAAYFYKLDFPFQTVETAAALAGAVRRAARTVAIIAVPDSPSALIHLARSLVTDPSDAYPHVFILTPGEAFDAQVEAITVISGALKLSQLAKHLHPSLRG